MNMNYKLPGSMTMDSEARLADRLQEEALLV